jgi:hypothetical protein
MDSGFNDSPEEFGLPFRREAPHVVIEPDASSESP